AVLSVTDVFYCCCFMRFFFFQAEDGIRDRNVTGVQTCALRSRTLGLLRATFQIDLDGTAGIHPANSHHQPIARSIKQSPPHRRRSEERRVGKESRQRWAEGREEKERQTKT